MTHGAPDPDEPGRGLLEDRLGDALGAGLDELGARVGAGLDELSPGLGAGRARCATLRAGTVAGQFGAAATDAGISFPDATQA